MTATQNNVRMIRKVYTSNYSYLRKEAAKIFY